MTAKVWGTPRAEIFGWPNMSGPLAEGDALTYLPFVAELKPGNRTHNVRLDIVAQEIEIGPDVRFQAWTFGGSVPGPVIHVREGDRVNFTLRNRSTDRVSVTQPDKSDAPFLQQLAAADQQKAVPLAAPMHHSIDFHAATVAADDKWRMILPGRASSSSSSRTTLGEDLLTLSVLQDLGKGNQACTVLGRDPLEDRRRLQELLDAPVHRAILSRSDSRCRGKRRRMAVAHDRRQTPDLE